MSVSNIIQEGKMRFVAENATTLNRVVKGGREKELLKLRETTSFQKLSIPIQKYSFLSTEFKHSLSVYTLYKVGDQFKRTRVGGNGDFSYKKALDTR